MKAEKIILGIDPGTLHLGYAMIKIVNSKIEIICVGTVHLNKLANQQLKLAKIFEKITSLIEEYKPDECAVECPFFGENAQSMLKLGRAQGVSMVAALAKDVPVEEYYPKKVKQSITGNGNASKEQVAAMLHATLKMPALPISLDATDALAVAVCHYHSTQNVIAGTKKFSGWKDFLNQQQEKVKK